MPVLYILLGVLGLLLLVLLLLLFLPVYARIGYDGELRVKLWVLGIPITLLPATPKKETPAKEKKKKTLKKKKPSKAKELKKELTASFRRDGVGATLHYLKQVAAMAAKAVGQMLRAVKVDDLRLELLIAGDTPATTAVRYGKVCSVLYPALSAVEQVITVRRRQLRVEPNFLAEKSGVYVDVRLHVWVFRVVFSAIGLLCRYIFMNADMSIDKKEVKTNGK